MEFYQLQLFLTVMEQQSVTRAAEKSFLSPGAVSIQMHNLAAELKTQLFTRSGKKIVPTPAAHRLAEHSRQIVRNIRQIEQEFANDPDTDERPVHIATGATTLIHRLGKPLRTLRSKLKQQIYVTVLPTEEIVAGILDRRFDLGVISLPYQSAGLRVLPLFEEELLGLRPSPKQTPSGNVVTIKPAELADAPFLLYPKRSNMRQIIEAALAKAGIEPRVIMEADDTEVIKKLVETGFGYSVLPQSALRGPRHFQAFRILGHKIAREQAIAMPDTDYPRMLTHRIAAFLQDSLAARKPARGSAAP